MHRGAALTVLVLNMTRLCSNNGGTSWFTTCRADEGIRHVNREIAFGVFSVHHEVRRRVWVLWLPGPSLELIALWQIVDPLTAAIE